MVMIEDPPPGRSNNLEGGGKLMLTTDPPEHTRYRKLVNKGFTPRMINALEKHIREQAIEIVDRAVAKGEADFVVDIAAELPLEAIAELIGVPLEDRGKLFDWSNRMIGSEDPEYSVSQEEALGASIEMFMYAQQLADQRRAEPRDDIMSVLLESEIDGERALGDGLQPLLPAAVGRRQRDHAQRDLPRHARAAAEPRPVPEDGRRSLELSRLPPRRSCAGRRRSCTSGATSPRTPSCAARS